MAGNQLSRAQQLLHRQRSPSQWHTDVEQFARVFYRDVYPGVNMAFYGVQNQLEFDFIIAPGASPSPDPARRFWRRQRDRNRSNLGIWYSRPLREMFCCTSQSLISRKTEPRQPVDARFVLQAGNQVRL